MIEPAGAGLAARLAQPGPIPLDAELSCAPGELLALVGPSGSGKTTILRTIAGLYRPRQGCITCADAVWLDSDAGIDLRPQRRSVGLVFQDYALFPHLSAEDNVVAALGHVRHQDRRRRARELLALVHLDGLGDRRPAALSGGQQQRVAVARALAREPSVLLLDEPFSAVDQMTRRRLQRELAQLRRRLGLPIVLVTHDLDEACMLADRMCILHRGRTLQTAPPFEILQRPRDAEVARLVDLRNLFAGEVAEHRPELTLLRWRDHVLEAHPRPDLAPGSEVDWLVPPSHVVLHRRDRPSRGEHENPLAGGIVDLLMLGESAHVTMRVEAADDAILSFSVPAHVARRNGLAIGEAIGVSLLAEGIHLMPRRPP